MKKIILLSIIVIAFSGSSFSQIQIQLSGPLQDVCSPLIASLEVVSPLPGYTYDWYIDIQGNCGTGFTSLVGSGTMFQVSVTGNYFCYGYPTGGGTTQTSNVIPIRVLPNVTMPLLHGSVSCVASAALCIPTVYYTWGGDVIKWYKNNVLIGGAVSSSYTATTPGYYKYSVASVNVLNLCSATSFSDSVFVSISAATITPTGSTTFCPGGSVILNANTGAGLSYQWKLNTVNIAGATNSTYTASASGSYTVVVTGTCGSVTSSATTVTVHPIPSAAISGTTTICKGNAANVIVSFSGSAPFSFVYNPGGIVVSNTVNPTVIPVSPSSTTTYSLVSVSDAFCAGNVSGSATVTVNPLPSATITPGGPTTFCSGGSLTLNAPVAANRTYQWKKGANLISGATLSSYIAAAGGNYRVIVTNTVTGCSKTTGSATVVTVNTLPAATITPQGPTIFCAGGSVVLAANTGVGLTHKWKKGSSFISGATLSNYTATIAGTYRVEVTNSNGCSKLSAGVTVAVPCKEGAVIAVTNNLDFTVYPNPNSGEFTIKFSSKPTFPIQIELTDGIGKVVKRFETNDEMVLIKESNLAKGIYCLAVREGNEMVTKKINIVK